MTTAPGCPQRSWSLWALLYWLLSAQTQAWLLIHNFSAQSLWSWAYWRTGPNWTDKQTKTLEAQSGSGSQTEGATDSQTTSSTSTLDEALACDCYQVLNAVCALPQGPEQLLTRGAVLALCRTVLKKQTLSYEKGLPLLGHLLSSSIRPRAWAKHSSDLLLLLRNVSQNFCRVSHQDRLEMCSQIPQFLPPPGVESESQVLKEIVGDLWASLQPLIQGKLSQEHLGSVLVVSACLLDLYGWESTGPPKFCCLLVNRACVEVRMGLEEPPGTEISPQLQHILTACYRIMEAAMEQACSQGAVSNPAQIQTAITGLSLQQSRQVLGALEEAFSAEIYYLKQVRMQMLNICITVLRFKSLWSVRMFMKNLLCSPGLHLFGQKYSKNRNINTIFK